MSTNETATDNPALYLTITNYALIAGAYGDAVAWEVSSKVEQRMSSAMRAFGGAQAIAPDLFVLGKEPGVSPIRDVIVEELCFHICGAPIICGDRKILVSLSVSDKVAGSGNSATAFQNGSGEWSRQYREDMRAASWLVSEAAAGNLLQVWRPIRSATQPGLVLHQESVYRHCDTSGALRDFNFEYDALQRIGLVWLIDRLQVLQVIRELEADSRPHISVQISAQSLLSNKLGSHGVWMAALERLERNPEAAARLVIEISEGCPITSVDRVKETLSRFKRVGVGTSVAGFASSDITFGHLLALDPDMVKISPVFLQSAGANEANNRRLTLLVNLASTMARKVVLDGVDTADLMRKAHALGVEWVAGRSVGQASISRGWRLGSQPHVAPAEDTVPEPANCDQDLTGTWG